jgi:hypothetical protein
MDKYGKMVSRIRPSNPIGACYEIYNSSLSTFQTTNESLGKNRYKSIKRIEAFKTIRTLNHFNSVQAKRESRVNVSESSKQKSRRESRDKNQVTNQNIPSSDHRHGKADLALEVSEMVQLVSSFSFRTLEQCIHERTARRAIFYKKRTMGRDPIVIFCKW